MGEIVIFMLSTVISLCEIHCYIESFIILMVFLQFLDRPYHQLILILFFTAISLQIPLPTISP